MGRAKGTKNDRASEPAPGRGVRPKILDELQEIGGMSPAWHRRNHLVQDYVDDSRETEQVIVSAAFPELSSEVHFSLRAEPWSPSELFDIFDDMNREEATRLHVSDPFVTSLWRNEKLRTERVLEAIGVDVDLDSMEEDWRKDFVSKILGAIQTNSASHAIEHSLLGRVLAEDDQGEIYPSVADKLAKLAHDAPELFDEIARNELLPACKQAGSKGIASHKDLFIATLKAWGVSEDINQQAEDLFSGEWETPTFSSLCNFREAYLETFARETYVQMGMSLATTDDILGVKSRKSFRAAFKKSIDMFLNDLVHGNHFDKQMEKICGGDLWRECRESYSQGRDEKKVREYIYKILSSDGENFMNSMMKSAIQGECTLSDWVTDVLRKDRLI